MKTEKQLSTVLQSTVALLSVLVLSGCGVAKNTKVAEAEVERFHQHWNANEFQAVFDEGHMQLRAAQPVEQFTATIERVKKNYGQLTTSTKRSWGFNSDNGVTDIKLSYDSAYEHGAAVEEFVYRMTGEKALLVSYDIMKPETAAKRDEEKKAAREAKREAEKAERDAKREARQKEKKP